MREAERASTDDVPERSDLRLQLDDDRPGDLGPLLHLWDVLLSLVTAGGPTMIIKPILVTVTAKTHKSYQIMNIE